MENVEVIPDQHDLKTERKQLQAGVLQQCWVQNKGDGNAGQVLSYNEII